jgi:hypothetical protein
MPSRAYVAHDHAVSVVRMYFQMVVVGLVLAIVLYSALMGAFLSHFVAAPIPEIRTINDQPHLLSSPRAGRLPLIAMFKYFISLNPKNYVRWNPHPRGSQPQAPQERVDRELLPLFQRELVPRNTYRKGVRLITHGRIDQLPWIFLPALYFFPPLACSIFSLSGK